MSVPPAMAGGTDLDLITALLPLPKTRMA